MLAAGGGTRFGGRKQFFDLGGEPLVAHPGRRGERGGQR
ncbi:NTP transferase domain-containing protein, partial [Frankia sp. AgKG'84/4]